MSNENKLIEYVGTVKFRVYLGDNDFRIYALDVDKEKFPDIKFGKRGYVSLIGTMHELAKGQSYKVSAEETMDQKNGYGYKLKNITQSRPQSSQDMFTFLSEILTENQAIALHENYPDIVDRVMDNRLDDVDLSLLKGIGERTFEIIVKKITDNFCLCELVTEFKGALSFSIIKKLYNTYPSMKLLRKKLREDPYKCLCNISGIGFKTADQMLLDLESNKVVEFEDELKTSKSRCMACVNHILEKNETENGHTKMDILLLKKQSNQLTPACAHHFVTCLKTESIIYDKESMFVSLKRTYDIEKYIADRICEGLHLHTKWDINCDKYKVVGGFELSEEQCLIPSNVCDYNISILNGAAGTGKSFSMQSVIDLCKDNNKSFFLVSPTGKAAKVLSAYTKEVATTIHRGLIFRPPNEWVYNIDNPLKVDLVILDEGSMVDIYLFRRLLDSIDFHYTKLLIVGDNDQLPSVACGNLLHDMIMSQTIPTVTLTKVFRYGEGGLMKVATDVRHSKKYLPSKSPTCNYFGINKDYAFINIPSNQIVKNVIELYKKLLTQDYKPEDIMVLTSYNIGEFGTIKLNNYLQQVVNPNYGSHQSMKVGDITYYKDDIVLQNTNNYHALLVLEPNGVEEEIFVANGETGIIQSITQEYVVIDFEGNLVQYSRSDMQMVQLGYSFSIHKSQGSGSDIVILITPPEHAYFLNANIIYVGLTRTRKRCFHIGSAETVNKSVTFKANFQRNTWLQPFLIKELKR